MSQQELVKHVVGVLDANGMPYMVTGSIASSLHGEPRSTHDIDLVVDMAPEAVATLVQAFPPPRFLLQEDAIRSALRNRSMFNLLSLDDGEKVDFWMLTKEPFDQARFARKCVHKVMGMELQVSSPEDTILAKLRWCDMAGGSEKQFTDALRIFELQSGTLDAVYLDQWAPRVGITHLLSRLRSEAKTGQQ